MIYKCETHGITMRVKGDRNQDHHVILVTTTYVPVCRLLAEYPVVEGQRGACRIVRVEQA